MLPQKFVIGITLGHNASVSLLCGGELLAFYVEERFSGIKYDSVPIRAIQALISDYPSLRREGVDHVIQNHTFIDLPYRDSYDHDLIEHLLWKHEIKCRRITHVHDLHHYFHALVGFFRSGLNEAAVVVADGCGSFRIDNGREYFENYTIFNFSKDKLLRVNDNLKKVYERYTLNSLKTHHQINTKSVAHGCNYLNSRSDSETVYSNVMEYYAHLEGKRAYNVYPAEHLQDIEDIMKDVVVHVNDTDVGGTCHHVKVYESVVEAMGWSSLEGGKLMGLAPYGHKDPSIPNLFEKNIEEDFTYRSKPGLFNASYPGQASINWDHPLWPKNASELIIDQTTTFAKNLAYKVQQQTQKIQLNLILKAHKLTKQKNIVITGGYAMNCSANYFYLEEMNKHGLKLFVEPISNDQGTSLGAAIFGSMSSDNYDNILGNANNTLYFGSKQENIQTELSSHINHINQIYTDAINIKENVIYEDIINVIEEGNIVALWQGLSEGGQRALGNRSLLFDPRRPNGKDEVNIVKQREFFRPFAGTILEEDVHDWFDLKGMKNSPFMMYAVNCREEKKHLIPSIVHVDGTCRIQTVTQEQNYHFYNLIKTFKDRTKVPILFNTSFNLGGTPLVENLLHALNTLITSDIKYLYMPEFQILLHIPKKFDN